MVGSGAARSLDPAEERRMPHFDRDEQHLVEREEHRDLDQHRPATGDRVDLLLLVQLHQRLLLLDLVVRDSARGSTVISGCTAFIFAIDA